MNHFLIPGRHPALSAAELLAVAEREGWTVRLSLASEAIFAAADQPLPADFPSWLGGMVKFGEVVGEAPEDGLAESLAGMIEKSGSRDFGISVYPAGPARTRHRNLGLEVKRLLRERGIKSRWVSSREPTLSAVVVKTNKLTEPGVELCVFAEGNRAVIGRTTTVQAFDEFSFRDFGRPRRDIRSGMLPVKLARMLINLSRTPRDGILLDPFCGSGTIVTEAALLGYRRIVGSDLEERAVADTSENAEWIRRHFDVSNAAVRVIRSPAKKIGDALAGVPVAGIATEPYLGPPLRGRERIEEIRKFVAELSGLYLDSFAAFAGILAPGGLVAVVFPVFRSGSAQVHLPILDDLEKIGFAPIPLLPQELQATSRKLHATPRGSLLYERPDQRVLREIFVFAGRPRRS